MKRISLVITILALGIGFTDGQGAFAKRKLALSVSSIIEGTGPLTYSAMAIVGPSSSASLRGSFHSKAASGFTGKVNSPQLASGPFERAYVANTCDDTVAVIDTTTNMVVATIPVGPKPVGVAITPNGTRVYVTNAHGPSVSVIATATNTVIATIPLAAPIQDPNYSVGVAITPDGSRAYVTNSGAYQVFVIDTATNIVIATIPVNCPGEIAITPDGIHAYVPNACGTTVTVIATATNTVIATVPVGVGAGPVGVAITPDGARAYVTNANSNKIPVIDTASNTVLTTLALGSTPEGIAITPDGTRVYVMDYGGNAVPVIETLTNTVIATISVDSSPRLTNPWRVAITPDGTRVYLTSNHRDTVFVIDTATNTVLVNFAVGACPDGFSTVGGIAIGMTPTQPCTLTCPTNLTASNDPGQCGAIVNYPSSISTGTCGTVACTPASGSFFPVGVTSVTCSTDAGPSCSFNVSVVNHPPTLSSGGPYSVNEGTSTILTAAGIDSDGDALIYAWDLDGNGSFETAGQSATFSAAALDGPSSKTISVRVTDICGASAISQSTVNVLNVAPTVGAVFAPVDPNQVDTTISAGAGFTDPGVLDTHTAVWIWGDGSTSAGTVTETSGSGSVSGSHHYTNAGVYTLTLTVTDKDGGSGPAIFQYVVVYDPSAGFVTGGGWINSPAGAYTPDPSLAGKATFGFVSKYQPGASVPSGNTQFTFHVASMNFNSTSYDWLVIAGARAQYKGTGTINGAGNYAFMLTASDGQVNGGGGVDRFRIKIWDKNTGQMIYDNQMGAGDDASPSTAIAGGSIVIHRN